MIDNRKVIAGNWKMYKTTDEVQKYIQEFVQLVEKSNEEIILFVPNISLIPAKNLTEGTNVRIGAQNMHYETEGAYTGEVSAEMLMDIGIKDVIIGHSERRQYYNETDETVSLKVKKAIELKINPIMCIGESLEERETGITEQILDKQIEIGLSKLESEEVKGLTIAYEPIWAIGTGKTATKEEANEAIKSVRTKIAKMYGEEIARTVKIQYGGSVKPNNAKELFEMSDIDGALVGGASLKPEDFAEIVNYNKEI